MQRKIFGSVRNKPSVKNSLHGVLAIFFLVNEATGGDLITPHFFFI